MHPPHFLAFLLLFSLMFLCQEICPVDSLRLFMGKSQPCFMSSRAHNDLKLFHYLRYLSSLSRSFTALTTSHSHSKIISKMCVPITK